MTYPIQEQKLAGIVLSRVENQSLNFYNTSY